MNRVILFAVAVGLMVGGSAFAGGACCSMKKSAGAGAEGAKASCTDAMSGLNLTDEQTAKISELEATCKAEGMTKESCAKAKEAMRAILTPEQQAKWDAACESKKADSATDASTETTKTES